MHRSHVPGQIEVQARACPALQHGGWNLTRPLSPMHKRLTCVYTVAGLVLPDSVGAQARFGKGHRWNAGRGTERQLSVSIMTYISAAPVPLAGWLANIDSAWLLSIVSLRRRGLGGQ